MIFNVGIFKCDKFLEITENELMIIGVTGGVGCGKSTAVKIFKSLGFRTLDSDDLVKEIYLNDQEVKDALREHFGKDALASNHEVDRGFLAKRVFENAQERLWLENLVHPKVKILRDKYIAAERDEWWVLEIPLLFEKNLESECDIIICLSARNDLQLSRLVQRGLGLEEAKFRIASQLPLEQKEKRADYVIYNNENIEKLCTQVCELVQTIRG